MQRLQNDKSNLDFWSILSAFWSFHDLWHHRNNICSVSKSHWYFAPCCSTLVQKIFWDTLCETGWKLTQFQTGKQEVAEDHHHHKEQEHHYQNHRKSVVRCENCRPMTQNDNVLSANPRYLKKQTCQYTFIITAKAGRRPLNEHINTMIMMMITVRSLYLMARQQNSLAVNPALAVTFVLGKWEWMSPNRESFF